MFFRNIHKRMKIILLIIFFILLIIALRVFYIQVIDYKKLNKYANSLWNRNLPIEGNRGIIYDNSGNVIVDNITTTSLIIIPNQVKDKSKTATLLANILGVSYNEMYNHVNKKSSIERVHPEGRRLDFKVADRISELNLPGIYLVKETKRNYPYNNLLAQSVGFVGIDNQGLSGLELMYDKYLTGEYGAIKYYADAKGNKLSLSENYEQPQDGMNLTLTINLKLQEALERELDNALLAYNPDQAWGIAVNPNNGEILAIASRPTFSPEKHAESTTEIINRNLPIWATYEPGSTFKIITLAASLEEKIVDLENDYFNDSGSIKVADATLHCWKHGGHGQQTYLEVVENSCNPGFVTLGLKLGTEKLNSYIKNFGFGVKTGVDLNGEASGILFNPNTMSILNTATTAFGQGVSVTAIQQVMAVSAAINGGTLYKPYIVKSINEPETNAVILKNNPQVVRKVISKETSDKVRYALESVVAKGTGRNAYIEGFRVGGKTGTAQKAVNGSYLVNNYIVSFIGFMPADDPQVVIYIAVDNPKGVTQYGGTVAAPLVRNVMLSAIDIFDLSPRSDYLTKEYNWYDIKYANVQDVTNMSLTEARKKLKNFKIEVKGTGDKIIYQSPSAGLSLQEGSTIMLYLN